KQLTHSSSIINYLQALLSRPLGFGLTALNDVFIMIGLGLTTKALKKKGLDESCIIDLLKTDDGVDSLKPLQLFNQLVSELSNEFLLAFERLVPKAGFNPYPALFSQLNSAGLGEDVEKVQNFL